MSSQNASHIVAAVHVASMLARLTNWLVCALEPAGREGSGEVKSTDAGILPFLPGRVIIRLVAGINRAPRT